jgi:hypothetical protein
MVVVEKIRRRIKARERVHFPGLHRWSLGSGNERPVWWEILSAPCSPEKFAGSFKKNAKKGF